MMKPVARATIATLVIANSLDFQLGIKVKEEKDIQIDMNVSSFIPDEYIENSSQKIEIYQDIALSKNEEDLANVIDEIIDRYGNMPKEVENLISSLLGLKNPYTCPHGRPTTIKIDIH